MADLSLSEAVEHAAKELPEGWTIHIEIMAGYGGVVLEDRLLNETDFDDPEATFAQRICEAVEHAKANKKD
jgi:hypothetical protein